MILLTLLSARGVGVRRLPVLFFAAAAVVSCGSSSSTSAGPVTNTNAGDGGSSDCDGCAPSPDASTNAPSAVACGDTSTCAVIGGKVKCWGKNDTGQLGNGTTKDSATPVDVTDISDAVSVAIGANHACALTKSGGVACWGYGVDGRLGNGQKASSPVPVQVTGLATGVTAITASWNHTCALLTNGKVQCWGSNDQGQLGTDLKDVNDHPPAQSALPIDVDNLEPASAISAGWFFTCAVTKSGAARCWGHNDRGQLGNGDELNRPKPTPVSGLDSGVAAIALGQNHACALLTAGTVRCWGFNEWGLLGRPGDASDVPVNVAGLPSSVDALRVGASVSCARSSGGMLDCWGQTTRGQLGNGVTELGGSSAVTPTGLSSGVLDFCTGSVHACAIVSNELRCWGANPYGELGGAGGDACGDKVVCRSTPTRVDGLD